MYYLIIWLFPSGWTLPPERGSTRRGRGSSPRMALPPHKGGGLGRGSIPPPSEGLGEVFLAFGTALVGIPSHRFQIFAQFIHRQSFLLFFGRKPFRCKYTKKSPLPVHFHPVFCVYEDISIAIKSKMIAGGPKLQQIKKHKTHSIRNVGLKQLLQVGCDPDDCCHKACLTTTVSSRCCERAVAGPRVRTRRVVSAHSQGRECAVVFSYM